MGISIAIDDFAMGHTSLIYLKSFPINTLKVDKTLSLSVMDNKSSSAILHSISVLCKTLKISMIVEYVETEKHLNKLLSLGCNIIQGYYFTEPLLSDDCFKYINDFH